MKGCATFFDLYTCQSNCPSGTCAQVNGSYSFPVKMTLNSAQLMLNNFPFGIQSDTITNPYICSTNIPPAMSGSTIGIIVGCVVGGVVLIGGAVAGVWWFMKKRPTAAKPAASPFIQPQIV